VLGDQYSFAAREFGQPVILSEVIAILQAVDGVVSLDIDHLQRTDVPDPVDPAPPPAGEISRPRRRGRRAPGGAAHDRPRIPECLARRAAVP